MKALPTALWLFLVALLSQSVSLQAEPFIPAEDGQVLERLPATPVESSARRTRALQAELARQPNNLSLATQVAWLQIEQGRALADPRYYGYAQGVLAPWWDQPHPPETVLILRATIRQHDHDFGAALADLALALADNSGNAQTWLTKSVVELVTGDYAAARKSCLELLPLASPLVAVTCLSNVDSLNGAAAKSYAALERAVARAQSDASERRWALTTLAEIAVRSGDAEAAAAHFKHGLALEPSDSYLLGAYADFLLDLGRAAEVVDLLGQSTRTDSLLLRLAIAERDVGSPDLESHVQALRDRFEAARLRGDTVHRREQARFALRLLDQPRTALVLARDNWNVQREPADARLLLEAAIAAGDPSAARPVLDFLARTSLEDVSLARLAAGVERAAP